MELASGDGAFGKLQACSVLCSGQQAPDFHLVRRLIQSSGEGMGSLKDCKFSVLTEIQPCLLKKYFLDSFKLCLIL